MTKNTEKSKRQQDTEPSTSLGTTLQRERQKKKLSLQEIALATKVPQEALEALENGDRKQLPVPVFAKGFVKIYCDYLGLNQNDILKQFQKEWHLASETETPEMLHEESMAQISPFYLSAQFYLILVAICLFLGLAFFFFNANDSSSQDQAINSIRKIHSLPASIHSQDQPVAISRVDLASHQVALPLISPTSAGKIPKEDDGAELVLATLPSVVIVQKKNPQPAPVIAVTQTAIIQHDKSINNPPATVIASHEADVIEIIPEDIEDISPSLMLPLDLHISFLARTKISISQDESSPEKYIFSSGEESTWSADKTISMQVEKAENVRITLNGKIISLPKSHQGSPLAITLPADLYDR